MRQLVLTPAVCSPVRVAGYRHSDVAGQFSPCPCREDARKLQYCRSSPKLTPGQQPSVGVCLLVFSGLEEKPITYLHVFFINSSVLSCLRICFDKSIEKEGNRRAVEMLPLHPVNAIEMKACSGGGGGKEGGEVGASDRGLFSKGRSLNV